jgi:hypothetical protein
LISKGTFRKDKYLIEGKLELYYSSTQDTMSLQNSENKRIITILE